MPTSTDAAPECSPAMRVSQMAHGFMVSAAIGAAVRLKIAETIGDGHMNVNALSEKLGTESDPLYRVLRLLSSLGIFKQVEESVFANTDESHTLRADHAASQRGLIEFITDPFHFDCYADMVPTIKSGRPAPELKTGKNIFEIFEQDAEEQSRFDNAMTNLSKNAVQTVLEAYDFNGIDTLVDVAGGHGALLTAILTKHSSMKGILFDLPHVVAGAAAQINMLGLQSRCSTVGGDFFKALPRAGAYLMRHIIHDWDDEHALQILVNCRAAMNNSGMGKLLLLEMLLPTDNEPHPSKFLDIEMMLLPGGRERTEHEYEGLLQKAGFRLNRVVKTRGPNNVLEAMPTA